MLIPKSPSRWSKGFKRRLSERLSCVETAGFNAKVQREDGKAGEKKGTQSRKGARSQREGREEVKKGTQSRNGAKVQREDSLTVG